MNPIARPTATRSAPLDAEPQRDPHAALRSLSQDLQSVFVQQLFAAMRASVPKDGFIADAPGTEMFDQMLDQKLASETSAHLSHGIADALYRQLSRGLPPAAETPEP